MRTGIAKSAFTRLKVYLTNKVNYWNLRTGSEDFCMVNISVMKWSRLEGWWCKETREAQEHYFFSNVSPTGLLQRKSIYSFSLKKEKRWRNKVLLRLPSFLTQTSHQHGQDCCINVKIGQWKIQEKSDAAENVVMKFFFKITWTSSLCVEGAGRREGNADNTKETTHEIPRTRDEEERDGSCGVYWDAGRQRNRRKSQREKFMDSVTSGAGGLPRPAEWFRETRDRIRCRLMVAEVLVDTARR